MRKIDISQSDLRDDYGSMSTSELLKKYDVSITTLYRMLDAAGIPRKRNRGENVCIKVI